MSVEEEQQFLGDCLEAPADLFLVATRPETIIGTLSFRRYRRDEAGHAGEFGMVVAEQWRRQGVGQALLETLLAWADSLEVIQKICLSVFSTNPGGIALYRKVGFEEEGRRLRQYRVAGSYVDEILMARWVGRQGPAA